MKYSFLLILLILLSSSTVSKPMSQPANEFVARGYTTNSEPPITQSLFNDKNSTISEENISKILDGSYKNRLNE